MRQVDRVVSYADYRHTGEKSACKDSLNDGGQSAKGLDLDLDPTGNDAVQDADAVVIEAPDNGNEFVDEQVVQEENKAKSVKVQGNRRIV